jgi:Domain of unknown function (DUF4280)
VPWVPTVMVENMPGLDMNCKLICNWGGVIQITFAGQVQIQM